MTFASELERARALAATEAASSNTAAIDQSYRKFDVRRCVIGTKLEVYYPKAREDITISSDWQRFTDLLIEFYRRLDDHQEGSLGHFEERVNDALVLSAVDRREAAAVADARRDIVPADWGVPEQLLLAEKLRLITAVRETRTSRLRRRRAGRSWTRWSPRIRQLLKECRRRRSRSGSAGRGG
jgi:hypothetical protein